MLTDLSFLSQLPHVEELELEGVEELDLSFVDQMPNLRAIKLQKIKELRHIERLGTLPDLREMSLWNIKKIVHPEQNPTFVLEKLTVRFREKG